MVIMDGELLTLLSQPMPYGKYRGRRIIDLPEPYLVWMARQGFSENQFGHILALAYEIKLNGLEALVGRALNKEQRWEFIRAKATRG